MPLTLRDCVAEFVGKPPGSIKIVMIHLRRAVEREAGIREMEGVMLTPFEIVDAVEGSSLIAAGHPTKCGIDPGVVRTAGEIGCIASHVAAARAALAEGVSHMVVFEDDCAPSPGCCVEMVRGYLQSVRRAVEKFQIIGTDQFLLLSTCGCYSWRSVAPGVKATNHFNGSHAYIMGRGTMQKLVDTYEDLLRKGLTAPVDGILPLLLQKDRRWALCPEKDTAIFQQNRAIPSYVVSNGTELRTD
jgi:GR25 family glycosyltransferase involved in LPS biosynthesis